MKSFSKFNSYEKVKEGINNDSSRTSAKNDTKDIFNKLLAGTAQGTIVALIPNAVLGAILKYFNHIDIIQMIINAALIFQVGTALIIGGLIAKQFDLTPPKIMIVGGAALLDRE